jgi:hypothetical protein
MVCPCPLNRTANRTPDLTGCFDLPRGACFSFSSTVGVTVVCHVEHDNQTLVLRLLQPAGNCRGVPLLDDGRGEVEIAVADPGGPHAPVHDARPSLAGGAVGKTVEIVGLHVGQLRFRGNLGNAFVLHGALVLPADNERDAGILYEVLMLARLGHGIEQKFPAVRDGDAQHCRLGGTLGRNTRLNRPGLGTQVGQQLGWREGVMMFAHGTIVPDGRAVSICGKPWVDSGSP